MPESGHRVRAESPKPGATHYDSELHDPQITRLVEPVGYLALDMKERRRPIT
jgi:hypothetical protein